MNNRISIIVCIMFLSVVLSPDKLKCQNGFWENSLHSILNRPVFGNFDQTQFFNNKLGISKIGVGLYGEKFDYFVALHDFDVKKRFRITQFCNINAGYKYYTQDMRKSIPFIDFCFLKTERYSQLYSSDGGGTIIGGNINIFDKRTTWYSNNDIEWVKLGLKFGYDFANTNPDRMLALIVYGNLGYEIIKPDTLTVLNLEDKYKKTWNYAVDIGVLFKANYKSISFEFKLGGLVGDINSPVIQFITAEIGYDVWKNKTEKKGDYDLLKTLRIYLIYSNENISIDKNNDQGQKIGTLYSLTNNIIKAGVSVELGRIKF